MRSLSAVLDPPLPTRPTWLGQLGRTLAGLGLVGWVFLSLAPLADPALLVGGTLVFTLLAAAPSGRNGTLAPLDLLFAGVAVLALRAQPEVLARLATGAPTPTDLLLASALLAVVLEAGRRAAGWPALLALLAWLLVLTGRDRLPGAFAGPPLDLAAFVLARYGGESSLLTTSFTLLRDWLVPIVLFAGVARGACLAERMAELLRPWGLTPLAPVLAAPALLQPAGPVASRLRMGALFPLTPPAVGIAALLAGELTGGVGELLWRLLPLACLALLLTLTRVAPSGWSRQPGGGAAEGARGAIGRGLVLGGAALALLIPLLSPPPALLGGALVMAVGAVLRAPTLRTGRALVAGVQHAAQLVPLTGSLLLLLALAGALNDASNLGPFLTEQLARLPAEQWPLGLAVLACLAGAFLLPAAALALLLGVGLPLLLDPTGAAAALLFWVGAARLLAERPHPPVLLGRLLAAAPLVLVALFATRWAFAEPGPLDALLALRDLIAVLALGLVLLARWPLGWSGRLALLLAALFLLHPGWVVGVGLVLALLLAPLRYGQSLAGWAIRRWRLRER
ncbi:MAG: hypothetical protein KatS3mg061_1719 [Dehalococcoidia bacterium]|nr:MAG: hypothetical protein KatS3mg061_1719 [Dehalococcoidia bacterium]